MKTIDEDTEIQTTATCAISIRTLCYYYNNNDNLAVPAAAAAAAVHIFLKYQHQQTFLMCFYFSVL